MTPHPQRCETCEYNHHLRCPYERQCNVERFDDVAYRIRLPWYTSLCGCASHSTAASGREKLLEELEETIDNWWRTYNDIDYDTYRRIPDKRGKNKFKHHHNMRTHIYKKYKMFFDCCKSPEGLQRMREFNKKVKEHLERQDQRNHVESMETLI